MIRKIYSHSRLAHNGYDVGVLDHNLGNAYNDPSSLIILNLSALYKRLHYS